MKKPLLVLPGLLLVLSACLPDLAYAQAYPLIMPGVGLIRTIAAENAANKAFAAKTTSTATYRGQSFLMKRTPDDILIGDAADRIAQVEAQLALCYTALLADSTSRICPPERQTTIRTAIKYIDLARPKWDQKAYHQEFRFYVAEDARRRQAAK